MLTISNSDIVLTKIQMSKLNDSDKVVNSKSLIKIIMQDIQFGHQRQFNAEGEYAQQTIEQGLGEKTV